MSAFGLFAHARQLAGLSQDALATRAKTSRPTLSAYEHGRKSPSLQTAARIVAAAGFDLALEPRIEFVEHRNDRGHPFVVPTALARLRIDEAFVAGELPLHLNWSDPGRRFDLADRGDRARVYEIVLREGGREDILRYIDGALLIDLWDDLVLPAAVRAAWSGLVARPTATARAA